MAYFYTDFGFDEATMIIHMIGMIYCVPILIISILQRNEISMMESSNLIKLNSEKQIVIDPILSKKKSISIQQKEKEKKIHSQFIQFTLISIILYTFSFLFSIIYNLPISKSSANEIIENIFGIFAGQCWNIAQIFCYLVFALKLKYVFEETEYQIDGKYFKYFYRFIALFGFGQIIISITIIFETINIITTTQFVIIMMIDCIIKVIITIFLSLSMIYLFVESLLKISINSDYGNDSFDESVSSSIDNFELLISNIATKLSVLSFWSLLSTDILIILQLFVYIILLIDSISMIGPILFIYNLVWLISNTINVTCLFLNMSYGHHRYNKLCKICDNKLKNMGKQKINELHLTIESKYHQLQQDDYH